MTVGLREVMASGSGVCYTHIKPSQITLNQGSDEEQQCYGYKKDRLFEALFITLVVLSLGLILLLMYWRPQLECYLRRKRYPLQFADAVLLQDNYKQYSVAYIKKVPFPDVVPGMVQSTYVMYDSGGESDTSEDVSDRTVLTKKMKRDEPLLRYFDHQHIRYVWDGGVRNFKRLTDLSVDTKCVTLQENFHGLSAKEQMQKKMVYSENSITVEVKSYWRLFIEEVMNPFYVFQMASIVLWSLDDYYIYAGCILFISVVSIGISLYETKRQSQTLHDMVKIDDMKVLVCRGEDTYEEVPTDHLVPGDVIAIPSHGCLLTCDAVLKTGTCIVNESMLTGESVPVTKTPLTSQEDNEIYSPDIHKRHTLFSGTKVLQTRYYGNSKVLAVVVRTGFRTAKGDLVRAILFPKPLDIKFYQDAMKFILFLACMAALGMTYSVINYVQQGTYPLKIIMRVLDIVTIIIPPALPAAMTVGTVYAQSRLRKNGIFCISPPRINFCGRLDVFCFDKTGTLTEDGLDMFGVLPVYDNSFCGVESDPSRLQRGPFLTCMATCHSLTIIDKEIAGDPLDLIMYNATKWIMEEPGPDSSKFDTIMPTVVRPCTKDTFIGDKAPVEVGIIRQFTFSSSMQRMSVITKTLSEDGMEVYCKGAPEKIASLCLSETVPSEFQDVLHRYTIQGYRVIALAYKKLDPGLLWHQAQRISRDRVEFDMIFLGLMVLQNKLKPQTKPVIHSLTRANIRTVMVTGDMIKTAISVARNCGIIPRKDGVVIVEASPPDNHNPAKIEWIKAEEPGDSSDSSDVESLTISMNDYEIPNDFHFAVSGKSFSVLNSHFPEYIPRVCVKGSVFARMSPDQKCQLIEKLQELSYQVGMCGDGANDCEALKAAHAGISLSEAEASVAAPFTSRIPHIECVPKVIREGRAALVTSFGCFKYMALYSFIQFISVLILYAFDANLSDTQYLYVDLVITTSIAILMGYSRSYNKLVVQQPPGSLVELVNILSIITQVLLSLGFQLVAFFYLRSQDWYEQVPLDKNADNYYCWETTVIFLVSTYQYIASAFVFSRGPPFREPIYKNIPYLLTLLTLFLFSTYMILFPFAPVLNLLNVMPLQDKSLQFRCVILAISVGYIFLAWILEYSITDAKCTRKCLSSCPCCKKDEEDTNNYRYIKHEMEISDWSPVGQVTFSKLEDEERDIQRIEEDFMSSRGAIN